MNGTVRSRVRLGQSVALASDEFAVVRAFDPYSSAPVSVATSRFQLIDDDRMRLAEVTLSLLPLSFAEIGMPVQNLEGLDLSDHTQELSDDLVWPHLLIKPTILWKDDLVCHLSFKSTAEDWTGAIRIKWCAQDDDGPARREVSLWKESRRMGDRSPRSPTRGRRVGLREYQTMQWGVVLALRTDQLSEANICVERILRSSETLESLSTSQRATRNAKQ